jgi:hypothetical protein
MSFDARSKERLEALGRSLPKKLPPPQPPLSHSPERADPAAGVKGGSADKARHRLEQEEDPAELFRALMKASPDGSVPPHLLDRLRELEGQPRPAAAPEAAPANSPQKGSKGQGPRGQGLKAQGPRGQGPKAQAPKAAGRRSGEDLDLYTAFAQLLLEDDEP